MKLTSSQISVMLEKSSKIDKLKNSCSMNERYYRILSFYKKRQKEEIQNYIPNVVSFDNSYNKIIIGHQTTTWIKADKKQSREILERMKSRRY